MLKKLCCLGSSFHLPLGIVNRLHACRRLCSSINGVQGALCRQHATFHGIVGALDSRHVQESGTASYQTTSREGQLLGQALKSALVYSSSSVGDAGGAFEDMSHLRVRFITLELLEGTQPWILVVQSHHKANGNRRSGFVQMIQEGPTVGGVI